MSIDRFFGPHGFISTSVEVCRRIVPVATRMPNPATTTDHTTTIITGSSQSPGIALIAARRSVVTTPFAMLLSQEYLAKDKTVVESAWASFRKKGDGAPAIELHQDSHFQAVVCGSHTGVVRRHG
jgi:hypothetical protein